MTPFDKDLMFPDGIHFAQDLVILEVKPFGDSRYDQSHEVLVIPV